MATRWKNILNWTIAIDGGGRVYVPPFDTLATNDNFKQFVLAYKDCDGVAKDVVYGSFTIPKGYVGSPKIVIVWSSSTTSGNVVFDFDYRAVGGNDSESLDQATFQESVTVTDAAPGAAWRRLEANVSLTAGNLAAGDEVEFQFGLDGLDGSHTFSGVAVIFALKFEYSDT